MIAGRALDARAVIETRTPILYHDWRLQPGADVSIDVPAGWTVMGYALSGRANLGHREIGKGELAILGDGETLRIRSEPGARLLLIGGQPLREPIARYGPFVMNSTQEIVKAIADYQSGRMGAIERPT